VKQIWLNYPQCRFSSGLGKKISLSIISRKIEVLIFPAPSKKSTNLEIKYLFQGSVFMGREKFFQGEKLPPCVFMGPAELDEF